MKKFIAIGAFFVFVGGAAYIASAKGIDTAPGLDIAGDKLPEQAGVYDVPGHDNLKLKVIVYHAKPDTLAGKPENPGSGGKDKTPPLPPSEVCNLADNDSLFVTPVGGWALPNVFEYRLNPNSAPGAIGSANAEIITDNAFAPWEAVVGAVDIIRGLDTDKIKALYDGENIVSWGRTSPTALAVTYLWYYTNTNPYTVVEIDMIMNQKFGWGWSDPSGWDTAPGTTCALEGVYDAQNIMTHEMGHWFGLDDTYTDEYMDNTMYGYGSPSETKKNSLTIGDILGVQGIYSF